MSGVAAAGSKEGTKTMIYTCPCGHILETTGLEDMDLAEYRVMMWQRTHDQHGRPGDEAGVREPRRPEPSGPATTVNITGAGEFEKDAVTALHNPGLGV